MAPIAAACRLELKEHTRAMEQQLEQQREQLLQQLQWEQQQERLARCAAQNEPSGFNTCSGRVSWKASVVFVLSSRART